MVEVVILHDPECASLPLARDAVTRALRSTGVRARVRELCRGSEPAQWQGFASPTVLVEGNDVVESEACAGTACRIYDADGRLSGAPPVERIVAALERARATTGQRKPMLLGLGGFGAGVAVLASWACCMPLLAAVLGASMTAAAMALEPWRPVLIAFAVISSAGSVAWSLRSNRRGCSVAKRRRWLPIAIVFATVVALALPWLHNWWGLHFA